MATAIGYIRVSTEAQAQDGVSLDMQRAKIEAWAMLNDYELTAVCLLYTSPSPRDRTRSRMPSSA